MWTIRLSRALQSKRRLLIRILSLTLTTASNFSFPPYKAHIMFDAGVLRNNDCSLLAALYPIGVDEAELSVRSLKNHLIHSPLVSFLTHKSLTGIISGSSRLF